MKLNSLDDHAAKRKVVLSSILRKTALGSIVGLLFGFLFSSLGKLGILTFLASVYAVFMLPRTYLSLLFFIICIPFSAVMIAGVVSPSMAFGFAALLSAFLCILLKGLKIHFDRLHAFVFGIAILASFSVLYGGLYTDDQSHLGGALSECRRYWFLGLFSFIVFNFVSGIRQIKQIMWVIVITCSILAIINTLQVIFQFEVPGIPTESPTGEFFFDEVGGTIRAQGTAAHPIEGAAMLQTGFIMSFFLLMVEKSPAKRFILILTTFLILPIGWVFTFTRASVIAIFGTIPYVLFKLRNKINKRTVPVIFGVVFFALVMVAFLVGMWGGTAIITRFESIFNFTENIAYRWRVDMLDAGFKMFLEHPVLGYGIGNYRLFFSQYLRPNHVTEWGFHRHGISTCEITYLTYLSELGGVGFLLFILLLVFALRNLSKSFRWYSQNGDNTTATLILGLEVTFWSLIVILLGSTFEFLKYFWLLIGLSAATRRIMLNDATKEVISGDKTSHCIEGKV